ncbi:MAG: response regulator [Rivularia sp. (in: Bacteria)]|nr:response regulator [Rivularia sp. MS3]
MNHLPIDLDNIRNQLMTSQRRKKQKILVVDDEPDNLDLLYRTFRRDFQVLKADSGTNALQVLAEEGEVAVIISDQRMPEMKGTEFLSKTLPQFPDTVRIILTGFTDIEDLVDAINAGQVYRYITKPWDPEELKGVVQRAAETYDLLKQRTEELRRANSQMALLTSSIQVTKTVGSKEESLTPIAAIYGETFAADGCILQLVENGSLTSECGTFSQDGILDNWLDKDPLIQESIATKNMKVSVNITKDEKLKEVAHYSDTDTVGHLVVPVVHANEVTAVLSLQWKKPCTLREDELKLIHFSSQLLALVLNCAHYS